jgi:hypothetical protein
MQSLDTLPLAVAGVGALVLAATIPATLLVRRLRLTTLARIASWCAIAAMILCSTMFIVAMIWGIESNWSDAAKACMAFAWILTVPAGAGAALLIGAAGASDGPGAVKFYFVALGIMGILILGLPALIFILMAAPGRP